MRTEFDMRPNPDATMDDISRVLLEEHLKTTGSKLAKELRNLGAEAVLQQMQLLAGPPENLKIHARNIWHRIIWEKIRNEGSSRRQSGREFMMA